MLGELRKLRMQRMQRMLSMLSILFGEVSALAIELLIRNSTRGCAILELREVLELLGVLQLLRHCGVLERLEL